MSVQGLFEIIEDKKINVFHFLHGPKTRIFVSELSNDGPSHVLTTLNEHFYYLLIAEHCFVVSKLCALRWDYLARFPQYENTTHTSGVTMIDLTTMFYDSNILINISHSSFSYTFLKILHERNVKELFMKRDELNAWRPFVELLIPPQNYWNQDDERVNVVADERLNVIIDDVMRYGSVEYGRDPI